MEFTYNAYRKLIDKVLQNGYQVCSYKNVDKFDKAIILRHDVDFSPRKAIDMARIEYQLGVKSTYFVLLSTEFYNVFSKETADILSQIIEMGHEIGLHFDEQRYNATSIDQMKDYVYKEASILEKALSVEVNTVSMHRPSKFTLDNNIEFEGFINSYSKKYFTNMKYVSDSRMHWRENIIDIIDSNEHDKIHILTHPFWYSDEDESVQNKLKRFLNEANISRYDLLDNNFRDLHEYLKREELLW